MEFSLGRASGKSPVLLYQQLEKKGQKWHYHGFMALIGNYVLMMFYVVVAGWMLLYFKDTALGTLSDMNAAEVGAHFSDGVLGSPLAMLVSTLIIVFAGFLVCGFGVKNGLERVTKVMMIALLVLMIAIAAYCCSMDGASEGLKFYLVPDVDRMKDAGIGNVIVAAMKQAFFTLSLGIGAMAIFGSYIGKDRSLMGESVNVALLDTFVAFTSGLIVFPACYAFNGGATDSGPSLIFVTLPNIFNNMPLGQLWGALFFVFMVFAAFSTVIGVFELIVACCCEKFGWSRVKSCVINAVLMSILALPCIFGFNIWSEFSPAGMNIMDWEDFLVSNILLPLGSLVFVLFCTTKWGWGWKNFEKEANEGKGMKVKKWMRWYMTYVLPVIISILFVVGILQVFGVM
jgi:NSS family neurotransmitter:Na+ symporter